MDVSAQYAHDVARPVAARRELQQADGYPPAGEPQHLTARVAVELRDAVGVAAIAIDGGCHNFRVKSYYHRQ